MLDDLKRIVSRNLTNIPGFRTNRKIVVFESDDWGMIRMASKDAYNRLLKKGYPVDGCTYNSNDALETNDDVQFLAEVLQNHRDRNGNFAKFTLNNIVANPDFVKIKANGFKKYEYEPFIETLKRYSNADNVIQYYKEGIESGVFQIQFHGREHVNVNRWIDKLAENDKAIIDAFEEEMFTVAVGSNNSGRREGLDSFGMAYKTQYEIMESVIETGTELFEKLWGYKSLSFIAPCYTWSEKLEPILRHNSVKYIQGSHAQIMPVDGLELKVKVKRHYMGQKNAYNQIYLVRNVHFEPAGKSNLDRENANTLVQIKNAFMWKKPAIISTHRVNYISRINPKNKENNLKLLNKLLIQIVALYPDVEFMSSDQLGNLIEKECAE
jgi:hypothetical protein